MPSPDPRPVGETLSETVLWTVRRRRKELVQAICDVEDCVATSDAVITALDAYRDAVAAEARAALLRDAPTVWVATDDVGKPDRPSRIWAARPVRGLVRMFMSPEDAPTTPCMETDRQLTPPGTCVRYRLVPDPEERLDG